MRPISAVPQPAYPTCEEAPYSWQRWQLLTRLDAAGSVTLRARATGFAGHTQPDEPERNTRGYGGNAVEREIVRCR
jgi:hypothetical protein